MGVPVSQTVTVYKGQTKTWRITVTDVDDATIDLTTVDEIEMQVKKRAGDPDPPVIAKAVGDGIEVNPQNDPDTRGTFDVTIQAYETSELDEGVYRYDVVLIVGSTRQYIVPVSKFNLLETVNNA